ncbi:MAG: hypothetical protein ABEN55_12245 [Bradymonadaceae bacterium]
MAARAHEVTYEVSWSFIGGVFRYERAAEIDPQKEVTRAVPGEAIKAVARQHRHNDHPDMPGGWVVTFQLDNGNAVEFPGMSNEQSERLEDRVVEFLQD